MNRVLFLLVVVAGLLLASHSRPGTRSTLAAASTTLTQAPVAPSDSGTPAEGLLDLSECEELEGLEELESEDDDEAEGALAAARGVRRSRAREAPPSSVGDRRTSGALRSARGPPPGSRLRRG